MKNLFLYIFLSLFIANTSLAKKSGCTDGDCNNGIGTWTYTDKTTYNGEWEAGTYHGKGEYTSPDGKKSKGQFSRGKFID